MRFSTIWSIPAMSPGERFRRTRDWVAMRVASMLPQRVRYWAALGEIGKAVKDSPDVTATRLEDILKNLEPYKTNK